MIWRTALFVSLSLVSSQAHAFFPSAPVNPPVAAVARSSVVAGGGGGGGGTPLLFAYNSGKFRQNSGTSLNVTFPDSFFSTNSLVTLGVLTGGTTIAHVKDNRGNLWVRDSTMAFSAGGTTLGIYHFVATNTYLGVYNATITVSGSQTIVAGFIVSSNTNTSAALDVSSNSSGTGAVVFLGTTTATNANTGICMSVFSDNSGLNDSKTWQGPYTLVASETDGTSFITGSIGFSTGSATVPINSAAQKGNCALAASKTWQSMTNCFKSP